MQHKEEILPNVVRRRAVEMGATQTGTNMLSFWWFFVLGIDTFEHLPQHQTATEYDLQLKIQVKVVQKLKDRQNQSEDSDFIHKTRHNLSVKVLKFDIVVP